MPDITWKLLVWAKDGTPKPTIGLNDVITEGTIAALTGLDLDGAGNCFEAEFVAVPSEVDIVERDILQLQVSIDAGVSWEEVYKGVGVITGAARADEFRTYKIVGAKARFYEYKPGFKKISGGDVGTMVRRSFGDLGGGTSTLPKPAGVSYSPSLVPLQNFQLGDRYPRLESWGAFLDDLAESVGAFIVPAGSTYSFNGVTYSAGETVPATKWGINADGKFYFTRPQAAPVEVNEGDEDVIVTWADIVSEEVFDRVDLSFASEYANTSPFTWRDGSSSPTQEPVPHPIAHPFGSGSFDAWRAVPLDAPLDYMVNAATLDSAGVAWSNPGNAVDENTSSYAECTDVAGSLLRIAADFPADRPGAIVRARYEIGSSGIEYLLPGGGSAESDTNMRLKVIWLDSGNTSLFEARTYWEKQDNSQVEEALWVLPVPADAAAATSMWLDFEAATGARLYEVEVFVVDLDAADLLAAGYLRNPERNASTVELVGQLGAVSQSMRLTPVGEAPLTVPVERIEYRITPDEGLSTTYHLGQAYEPELMSQRAVLEAMQARIARRAVKR